MKVARENAGVRLLALEDEDVSAPAPSQEAVENHKSPSVRDDADVSADAGAGCPPGPDPDSPGTGYLSVRQVYHAATESRVAEERPFPSREYMNDVVHAGDELYAEYLASPADDEGADPVEAHDASVREADQLVGRGHEETHDPTPEPPPSLVAADIVADRYRV